MIEHVTPALSRAALERPGPSERTPPASPQRPSSAGSGTPQAPAGNVALKAVLPPPAQPATPAGHRASEDHGNPADAPAQAGAPPVPVPCLNSSNGDNEDVPGWNDVTPYHRRQAFAITHEANALIERVGLNQVGFLTLTTPQNIVDAKDAQRLFKLFQRRVLKDNFGAWMVVRERQQRGSWHWHLLIDCKADIRTGLDFDAIHRRDYRTAGKDLRRVWAVLRKKCPAYHLGRHELLPIRSNAEAVGRYVAKYVAKHVGTRRPEDRRVRLFGASSKARTCTVNFAWNSPGGWVWRQKLRLFCQDRGMSTVSHLWLKFGPNWAYWLRRDIERMAILRRVAFPSRAELAAVDQLLADELPETAVEIYVSQRKDSNPSCTTADARVFPTGYFSKSFPAKEDRSSQVTLARRCASM